MSNIFKNNLPRVPFFPMPQDLVKSGTLRRLSEGALKLYHVLLYEAQRHSTAFLELSNNQLKELAGLSPSTLRRARTELWEAGLVDLITEVGRACLYVVLEPTTTTLPGIVPKKFEDSYRKSWSHARESTTPVHRVKDTVAPNWNEVGQ